MCNITWGVLARNNTCPEATPCRKQILSSEKDFAAVVSVLVAEAQAHWAIDESR